MSVGMRVRTMGARTRMDSVSRESCHKGFWERLRVLMGVVAAAAYVCDEVIVTSSPYIHSPDDVGAPWNLLGPIFWFLELTRKRRHTRPLVGILFSGTRSLQLHSWWRHRIFRQCRRHDSKPITSMIYKIVFR
jgi:hypothetical protein